MNNVVKAFHCLHRLLMTANGLHHTQSRYSLASQTLFCGIEVWFAELLLVMTTSLVPRPSPSFPSLAVWSRPSPSFPSLAVCSRPSPSFPSLAVWLTMMKRLRTASNEKPDEGLGMRLDDYKSNIWYQC